MKKKLEKIALAGILIGIGVLGYNLAVGSKEKPHVSVGKLSSIIRLVRDGQTICSGTVVSDEIIITAAHCVLVSTPFGEMLDPAPLEIRSVDNRPRGIYATPGYINPQMDQALLRGDFTKFSKRDFISDPNALTKIKDQGNTKFIACGYPLFGDLYCSALVYESPLGFMWAVKGVLLPGMSGGPTMLPDGTVIGVNVAVTNELSVISPLYNVIPHLLHKDQ